MSSQEGLVPAIVAKLGAKGKATGEAEGPVANLCLAALDRAKLGADEAEHALDHSGSIEMASMEKNMTWISLCIATAPMWGFLGTVWGMMQAFNDIIMARLFDHKHIFANDLQ